MEKELEFEYIAEDIKFARSTKDLMECNLKILKFSQKYNTGCETLCREANILADLVSNKVQELQNAGILTMKSIGGIK